MALRSDALSYSLMPGDSEPMDPMSAEVVKAVTGPLTEGGQKVLAQLFGGAAGQLGAYFKDRVVLWRAGRGIYTAQRSTEMLVAAGLKPKPVAMKALLNIMDGATLEDDDEISEMWAALLANASVTDLNDAEAAFSAILRQLSLTDAVVLKAAAVTRGESYTRGLNLSVGRDLSGDSEVLHTRFKFHGSQAEAPEIKRLLSVKPAALEVAVDNLFRLGLLADRSVERVELRGAMGGALSTPSRQHRSGTRGPLSEAERDLERYLPREVTVPSPKRNDVTLTALGAAFLDACEPPPPSP